MVQIKKIQKLNLKLTFFFFFFLCVIGFNYFPKIAHGYSTTPYDVPSSVKSGWNDRYGSRSYSMNSGKLLVYDVYKDKYISGGYNIVNKDFGKGTQPYLNFTGWAVLFGYHSEYKSNNDTYIVAVKTAGDSGVGTTKIYSTLLKDIDATEDLEYNNQGSGLYNPCSDSTYNVNNTTCNMKYESVGFSAYLPLKELFPKSTENAKWKLYIVKKVGSYMAYTQLILPFEFSNRDYNNGSISLSSGVNAKKLIMGSTGVLRRSKPRQDAYDVYLELGSDRYFTQGRAYTEIDSEETKTAIWYGVKSPEDNYKKKWASSAYWDFGGAQAMISYDPPPYHVSDEVLNARYVNGNDYWFQPYDQAYVRLEQRDLGSGNKLQYLRLEGEGQDVRSRHDFDGSTYDNLQFFQSPFIAINSAYREVDSSYGQVKWGVVPKRHGDIYNIEYYYQDKGGNHIGYNDTYKNIRVDGKAPQYISTVISTYRYKKGNDYWVKPNDHVLIKLRQYDPDSGNKYQYLRLWDGINQDVRSRHGFDNPYNDNNTFGYGNTDNVSIDSAYRIEDSLYGQVQYSITPKVHGGNYNIQYYFTDHAENTVGYSDTGLNLRVDGVAPYVYFRNNADTADFYSRGWASDPIYVRLKFGDSNSGYKESRYTWTQSTSTPSSWSAWTTNSNYVVSNASYGQWYLHVQAIDNVGNTVTTYKGPYRLDNPPLAEFTASPNPTDRLTTVKFTSKASDPNGNSLTYNWYYRKSSTSTWTQFSTIANPSFKFSTVDSYYVRQIVKDSYGMSDFVDHIITVNDLAPNADFNFSPSIVYEGDNITFNNTSRDPEGDSLKANWTIKDPNGSVTTFTTWNISISKPIPGNYSITLKVIDSYNKYDVITKTINVNPLTVTGSVSHTEQWELNHEKRGDMPNQFFSGEKFMLNAVVTDHPILSVKVNFSGKQITGNLISLDTILDGVNHPIYTGSIYDDSFNNPQTQLSNGTVYFLFTTTWQNGIVKTDLVPIQIIDDSYSAFYLHQTN